MRGVAIAVIAAAFLAGPALAQQKSIPKYGELDKDKTAEEKRQDKEGEDGYRRSLGNIPAPTPVDPWGNVRSDTPKQDAKAAPAAKKTKTGSSGNQPQ